jgi:alpha-tubulin suppressor-like RCC1 family protein
VADLGPPKAREGTAADGGPLDAGDVGLDAGDGGLEGADGPGGAASVKSVLLVALGTEDACAVVDEGAGAASNIQVRCWGSNAKGQLGAKTAAPYSSTPVTANSGLLMVASVPTDGDLALATSYACVVNLNHRLSCWGNVAPDVPQTLAEINAASIAENGGCVVYGSPLALKCWGAFTPTGGTGVVPQDGGGAIDNAFQSVAVGGAHACGIRTGGADAYCWGANNHGQLGTTPGPAVGAPSRVGLQGVVLKIAAGLDSTCALVAMDAAQASAGSGSVYCWGANGHGQVGIDSNGRDIPTPNMVRIGPAATEIAVGETHACAVLQDASVWCWGDNTSQQLGVGTAQSIASSAQPLSVKRLNHAGTPIDLGDVKLMAAGGQTTCAIDANFQMLWCWGANDLGQAGQSLAGVPISERVVSYATPIAW